MTVKTRPWLVRLTNTLLDYRGWWLCLAILTTLAAVVPASHLRVDQSIESLYAKDNPRRAAWRDSKRLFGGDEFVVVAYTDPELFEPGGDKLNPEAAERIEALAEKLRTVPGLETDTFQHLAHALQAPFGRSIIRRLMEGILVGTDEKTTSIFCRLEPAGTAPIPRSETYRRVREIADAHIPRAAVVGEPVQVHDMFGYVDEDGITLGLASSLLLMTLVFLLFRRLRWMVAPLLVVQIALIWTKALLVLCDIQLSMISSMVNSLVTTIGIATAIHIALKYREHRANADSVGALRTTMLELTTPIFWTMATTVVGFAALLTSQIAPVVNFSIMMTLATVLMLFAYAFVLPGGILIGKTHQIPGKLPAEDRISQALSRLAFSVERHPLLIAGGTVVLTIFCGVGLFHLKVETDFSKNFRANSPIVRSLDLFETRLSGAGTWEVNFPAPHNLDSDFLDVVRQLVTDLRDLEDDDAPGRLTKVVSLTDGLDVLTFLPLSWRISALERMQPDFITSLYNSEEGRMRIMLRARERQPAETKLKLIGDVEATARRHFPEARTTGLFVLLTYLIESLMADQLRSFLIAAAAVVILTTIAFRSLAIGAILLIPNLVPIVLTLGATGWIGLPINLATAMIASVSIGLTVVSSIHYLTGYTDARKRGLSDSAALQSTHQRVGLALIFANIALVIGFSALTLSHFIPLVYFGVLISLTMVGGLMGNLILLPLLLRIVDQR